MQGDMRLTLFDWILLSAPTNSVALLFLFYF